MRRMKPDPTGFNAAFLFFEIFYKIVSNFVGGEETVLTLTYEYKAIPTNEQIQQIEHTLTVCRKVWNFAL
jgi:hypothetical protein